MLFRAEDTETVGENSLHLKTNHFRSRLEKGTKYFYRKEPWESKVVRPREGRSQAVLPSHQADISTNLGKYKFILMFLVVKIVTYSQQISDVPTD